MAKVSTPIFKPGQPVKPAAGQNVIHNNIVQVVQVAQFTSAGEPNLYHVLKADNTLVYLQEFQLVAK